MRAKRAEKIAFCNELTYKGFPFTHQSSDMSDKKIRKLAESGRGLGYALAPMYEKLPVTLAPEVASRMFRKVLSA